MQFPQPWTYRHYKWWTYEVIWVVRHTDTQEDLVLYRGIWDFADMWESGRKNPYFVRSLAERHKPGQDKEWRNVERYVKTI